MAHILNKGKFPLYRTVKENLMILHPEEHRLIDQGTEEQRETYKLKYPSTDWSIFYNKQEELKLKYPEL